LRRADRDTAALRRSWREEARELARRLEAVLGLLREQTVEQRLVVREIGRQPGDGRVHGHVDYGGGVGGLVHAAAGEHLIKNNPEAVEVGAAVHRQVEA